MFSNKISKIFYCYSDFQPSFLQLSKALGEKIKFVRGFSGFKFFEEQGLEKRTAESEGGVIICLDDVLEEILKQKDALGIFTRLDLMLLFNYMLLH